MRPSTLKVTISFICQMGHFRLFPAGGQFDDRHRSSTNCPEEKLGVWDVRRVRGRCFAAARSSQTAEAAAKGGQLRSRIAERAALELMLIK